MSPTWNTHIYVCHLHIYIENYKDMISITTGLMFLFHETGMLFTLYK